MVFFTTREQRESDFQDDLLIKEVNRYQNLLAQFIKYRKARLDQEDARNHVEHAVSQACETK